LLTQPQPIANNPHPIPPKEPEPVAADQEGPTDDENSSGATTQGEEMPVGAVIN